MQFSIATIEAQQLVRRYYIGDTVPQLKMHVTIKSTKQSAEVALNNPGKKLTVLDFWATDCGTCIAGIPRLERLQSAFHDDLQILMVNLQPDSIVDKFFADRERIKKTVMRIPLVRRDTLLEKMFPTYTIPHYVWIDQYGVVRAITKSRQVDSTNIAAVLNDQGYSPPMQLEYHLPWGWDEPMFTSGVFGNGENTMWHSVLSGYVDGLPSRSMIAADSINGFGILMMNVPIADLYSMAYGSPLPDRHSLPNSKYSLFSDDKSKGNLYCYQLLTPPLTMTQMKKYMQEDLYRSFGLQVMHPKNELKKKRRRGSSGHRS